MSLTPGLIAQAQDLMTQHVCFPLLLTLKACLDHQSETLHERSGIVLRAELVFSSSNSEASGHRCLDEYLAYTGTVYSHESDETFITLQVQQRST